VLAARRAHPAHSLTPASSARIFDSGSLDWGLETTGSFLDLHLQHAPVAVSWDSAPRAEFLAILPARKSAESKRSVLAPQSLCALAPARALLDSQFGEIWSLATLPTRRRLVSATARVRLWRVPVPACAAGKYLLAACSRIAYVPRSPRLPLLTTPNDPRLGTKPTILDLAFLSIPLGFMRLATCFRSLDP
jgi:hypothetical protein